MAGKLKKSTSIQYTYCSIGLLLSKIVVVKNGFSSEMCVLIVIYNFST